MNIPLRENKEILQPLFTPLQNKRFFISIVLIPVTNLKVVHHKNL